jgi:hypothetical protein
MSRLRLGAVGLFVLVATGTLVAADLPWVGKWKINPAKSDFGESTVTYGAVGSEELQMTADGMSMKFKMDGKDYADAVGGTSAWKQIDASTWDTVNKVNGKVVSTDTTKLSADGKTLTVTSKGTAPNGKAFDNVVVLTRVSGGPGLPGKWKTSKVNLNAPSVIEIAAYEGDGLALHVVDFDSGWSARFDGKEYPVTGPTVPAGFTVSLKRTGARSYDYTQKQNGKELYNGTVTVSDDGKTTTVVSTAVQANEKTTAVYDKQ